MKNMIRTMAVALLGTVVVSTAQAGIHIEPYVGYMMGEIDDTVTPAKGDATGTGMGLRLGWGMLGFAVGLDYGTAATTGEFPAPAGDIDVDVTDMGLFVSYEFPILVRAYATYVFDAEAEVENSSTLSGTGTKIGVGFTGLPFVAINVEMFTHSYDEEDPAAASTDTTFDGTMVSLSLPLSF